MNILMVYPEFPDTFWSHSHALHIIGKKALLPPLGLLTVAAMLPAEWGKKLVDLNVSPLRDADLDWADWVFISGMGIQRDAARRIISRCKAAGKKVLAGGPLFSAEYALFEDVEHFVLSEGERTVAALVADMEQGCVKRTYRSREFADLSQSPAPMWELADLRQYGCAGVQYSRGCPYDCEFCNITTLLGRKPRVKSGDQVIAELESLYRHGWRGPVFFVDDNLIGPQAALKKDLLPALKKWQKLRGPMQFITQASINLADDPVLMADMAEAGFVSVFVGIETPDPDGLAECSKQQNTNRNLVEDVRRLQRAGLEVQAGFIVGFDHDTPAIFQRQVDFIEQSGIVTAMVGMLHAPPGTKLAARLWHEGRLDGVSSGDNMDGTTNVVPKMGMTHLRQGYRWLLHRIFDTQPCYRRIKTFLKEYAAPRCRSPLSRERLWVFFRSIYYLGVIGNERTEYWSLLLWTLFNRPSLVPAAVRLAVCAHHYRRMSEDHDIVSRALAAAEPMASANHVMPSTVDAAAE